MQSSGLNIVRFWSTSTNFQIFHKQPVFIEFSDRTVKEQAYLVDKSKKRLKHIYCTLALHPSFVPCVLALNRIQFKQSLRCRYRLSFITAFAKNCSKLFLDKLCDLFLVSHVFLYCLEDFLYDIRHSSLRS